METTDDTRSTVESAGFGFMCGMDHATRKLNPSFYVRALVGSVLVDDEPLVLEQDPVAVNVAVTSNKLVLDLADGRSLVVPLSWYPRLLHGSEAECRHWQLLGDGYAIEWPDLDEHIGVEGLVAGHRSGESSASFDRWLASGRK